jgi:hypothetical protein
MFEDLKAAWITEELSNYKAILLPSLDKQLSTSGLMLDLNSLPSIPVNFKELFIRWLILINKDRIEKKQSILITKEIVLKCPIWKVVKCPLKKITLTKESMFNAPKPTSGSKKTVGTIGSTLTVGRINKSSR